MLETQIGEGKQKGKSREEKLNPKQISQSGRKVKDDMPGTGGLVRLGTSSSSGNVPAQVSATGSTEGEIGWFG